MHKLFSTAAILFNTFMARTFGEYRHTIGGHDQPMVAIYIWRGQTWWIPTGPVHP